MRTRGGTGTTNTSSSSTRPTRKENTMAKMLYDRDSTERHVEAAKRFIRLCKRMGGTEELVAGIEPALAGLESKRAEAAGQAEARMYASDALVLADAQLDNAVRTAFERCQQFDRTSAAALVLPNIFPGESFGDLVRTPVLEEPDAVRELVVRLESLDEQHELYAVAAELRRVADASVQAASD